MQLYVDIDIIDVGDIVIYYRNHTISGMQSYSNNYIAICSNRYRSIRRYLQKEKEVINNVMVNTMGSMRSCHDSIWNTRALEMGYSICIYNVAWYSAVPSIIRGTSLVPLLFSRNFSCL